MNMITYVVDNMYGEMGYMKTILTGVTAYISTGLDYLIILMVIFGRVKHQDRWLVLIGDFLGTIILVGSSLAISFFLGFVPAPWLLGFLGLIPIYLGIKLWVAGDDDDTDDIAAKVADPKRLIWSVALITMATCGADNVGKGAGYRGKKSYCFNVLTINLIY